MTNLALRPSPLDSATLKEDKMVQSATRSLQSPKVSRKLTQTRSTCTKTTSKANKTQKISRLSKIWASRKTCRVNFSRMLLTNWKFLRPVV